MRSVYRNLRQQGNLLNTTRQRPVRISSIDFMTALTNQIEETMTQEIFSNLSTKHDYCNNQGWICCSK